MKASEPSSAVPRQRRQPCERLESGLVPAGDAGEAQRSCVEVRHRPRLADGLVKGPGYVQRPVGQLLDGRIFPRADGEHPAAEALPAERGRPYQLACRPGAREQQERRALEQLRVVAEVHKQVAGGNGKGRAPSLLRKLHGRGLRQTIARPAAEDDELLYLIQLRPGLVPRLHEQRQGLFKRLELPAQLALRNIHKRLLSL